MAVVINGTSGYIADFSNATVSSRQAFQTSTTNGSTGIYALPNGTSTAASWQATNAADPTNASKILIATNGSTDVQLVSGINGTGTYLPLSFYTSGAEKMRLDTSGNLGLGVTPSAWNSGSRVFQLGTSGVASLESYSAANYILNYNCYRNTTGTGTYIYATTNAASQFASDNTGAFYWLRAPSGTAGNAISFTQAMTLDASGNLGIGTTSPGTRVDAVGTGGTLSGTAKFVGRFVQDTTTYRGVSIGYDSSGQIGIIYPETSSAGSNLAFWTYSGSAWGERARITSGGELLVNLTSQVVSGTLCVKNASIKNGIVSQDAGSANYLYQGINSVATNVFIVASTGNVTNTNNSYGAISDIKLKENITDATPKLAQLNQVRIVNYNLIGETQKQIGVIAQELEQIFPGMVEESKDYEYVTTTDENGEEITDRIEKGTTKQVKYSVFVPMLIKAIQEQQAIITQLQADVAALKGNA